MNWGFISGKGRDFVLESIQTDSGRHPASCSGGTGGGSSTDGEEVRTSPPSHYKVCLRTYGLNLDNRSASYSHRWNHRHPLLHVIRHLNLQGQDTPSLTVKMGGYSDCLGQPVHQSLPHWCNTDHTHILHLGHRCHLQDPALSGETRWSVLPNLHNCQILSIENNATVDALSAVVPKIHVIWDVMLCGWVNS